MPPEVLPFSRRIQRPLFPPRFIFAGELPGGYIYRENVQTTNLHSPKKKSAAASGRLLRIIMADGSCNCSVYIDNQVGTIPCASSTDLNERTRGRKEGRESMKWSVSSEAAARRIVRQGSLMGKVEGGECRIA
ncbi:hypothetical protein CRG98_041617 [Punica granatum]|uniref:Uncharacterized protein n=1 Tax=Punica granatum TaxID=22663 RepID=A0A2I0I231_PUNGR|nr:hypothetical protein CRG98_041617 [Punica granatum]